MENSNLIQSLLASLEQPTQLLQTHISWVILSGRFAYKIKKPINFGFIDYTTLETRKYYCDLEIDLNTRLAAPLYIKVVPIGGTTKNPIMDTSAEPIEYAVKMHAFDQNQLFSNLIIHNDLTVEHIIATSEICGNFHQNAQVCDEPSLGTAQSVFQPMLDNFTAMESLSAGKEYSGELNIIKQWCEQSFNLLKPLIKERKNNGFIRACHGDLHLGNIVLYQNKPMIFDCIEFNESFRWTDVISDVAFMAMDLEDKRRADLASIFINHYFDMTNDYDGVQLLTLYQSYRAMVRAKIAAIQLEHCETPELIGDFKASLNTCIELALSYTTIKKPSLILTHGVSGSGKTTFTNQLLTNTNVIRISSDVIRKHLFDLPPFEPSPAALETKLYSEEANQKVTARLLEISEKLIKANYMVILDATFLRRSQRSAFVNLAKKLNVEIKAYSFQVPESILQDRLARRALSKTASDASYYVAEQQLRCIEPILSEEGIIVEEVANF